MQTVCNSVQLAGPWRFLPDAHGDGERLGFWQEDYDVRRWGEVAVPSCFDTDRPDLSSYEGACWYRRTFRLLRDWRARRVVLRFEAVNYRASVWLNGELLGRNQDGFLPFEFEIQKAARWNGDEVLVVCADNAHHEGDVPGMHVGWRGFGGILREVSLRATAHFYIEDCRVVATPRAPSGDMEFRLRVRNAQPSAAEGIIDLTVCDDDENACADLCSEPIALEAGASLDLVLKGTLADARPWSPSSPVLYRARVRLAVQDQVLHEKKTTFGFRQIEATPDGLLLNGEPIFLTGFNRHEDSPRTNAAVDLQTTREDLGTMKEAGANFVRLCHYPHHPAELDRCDELGLLVFAEIPLYFWRDVEEGRRTHADRVKAAARQLGRMIARDYNHPSVVFWSVSNETADEEPAVAESNRELIRAARELDPTRLCVHVSDRWHEHPNFGEDDVICVNWYPSICKGYRGQDPATIDLTVSTGKWRAALAGLRDKYPSKPILVTEFGYYSMAGAQGHTSGEDMHARVIEAEFAAMTDPPVCGATIWCWADHAWPPGRFFTQSAISPFGVVTRDRRRLKPFWAARKLFRAKQGIVEPARTPGAAGTGVIMVRPNLQDIPAAAFPDGYGIRPMTIDDIGLWTDIERDAEPYLKITEQMFRNDFGDDLESISRRCFIVTDPRGLGVGTISSWYDRDFYGQDNGRIHWLAVRPAYQRKGLAAAALSYALNAMAQWHDRCCLFTSAERLPAIRLYLNYGFESDLRPEGATELWRDINARLG